MIEIKITGEALGIIEGLKSGMRSSDGCVKIIAKRLKDVYKAHFYAKNTVPNKMGWPSRGVWAKIAGKTTVAYAFEDRAGISIADPIINQKVYGGPIRPKTKKSLAIPATAEAYLAGSPREGGAPALKFGWGFDEKRGVMRPALLAKDNYQRQIAKGKRAGQMQRTKDTSKATAGAGKVWYWLVWAIKHQDADPTALPEDSIVLNMIQATAKEVAREIMRRNGAIAAKE